MNIKKITQSILVVASAVLLAHCSKSLPPGDYDANEVGKVKKVIPGTIVSLREVRLHNKKAESMLNNPAEPGYADNSLNHSHGMEYVIRLNSGGIISVVQAESVKLKPKQHVLVIYGENTRVVPDEGGDSY
jgi:outer membrane lipoprotein SlyB